jgi:type I restriction enzyme M protein
MSIELHKRRRLRQDATDGEALLWRMLRGRRFGGFKFRRQHSVGPYIVDFFCHERRLAIELDGSQHLEEAAVATDARRTAYLASGGITVIRFGSDRVFRELDLVLLEIAVGLGMEDTPNR